MAITPTTIIAAALMAMRAEMLRIFFSWRTVGGIVPGIDSVELGFRTIGLGRTVGQDLLAAAPQRDGLADTE